MTLSAHAPESSAGPAPPRPLHSVRRTSTLDTSWPDGRSGPMQVDGHARDSRCDGDLDECHTIYEARCRITATPLREITHIETTPTTRGVDRLIGVRAGGQSRAAIAQHLSEEAVGRTGLHLLLDDFAGASLVAGWAWSCWKEDWIAPAEKPGDAASKPWVMEGICAGFAPGASSLNPDGTARHDVQSSAEVGSLIHPKDPNGWHELAEQTGPAMRRARWIDVWHTGPQLHVRAGFQDSATNPRGGRTAIHEYRVAAVVNSDTMVLESLTADPRVLPYRECPMAANNTDRLVGLDLREFRRSVVDVLAGTLGCTHLNDVLRGFADVPALAARLGERHDE